jgi:hypothetical protein
MSPSDDRRKRDLDLLMKSYKALEAEQNGEVEAPPARRATDPAYRAMADQAKSHADDDDGEVMMYRGRKIRKGSGGIPGAGSSQAKGRQFRGSTGEKKKKGASSDQLKAALTKLTELYEEGLISKAEYDNKRLQILDRL